MVFVLTFFLFLSILFEGIVTPLPLVMLALLYVTIIIRHDTSVFILAFISGLFLDAFAMRPVGGTSIFLLIYTLMVLLYQRKYEINSYQFVLVSSFFGSLLYLSFFSYANVWIIAGINSLFACAFFGFFRL